ncbi:MAG: hypothetical protein AAGI01_04335 [Myxococcota bacterium]
MLSILTFLALTALGMAALGGASTSRRPSGFSLRATLEHFARQHALWIDADIDFRGRARAFGTVHGARTQILYGDVLDAHGTRRPTLRFHTTLPHDLVSVPELLVETSSNGALSPQRAHAAWLALADDDVLKALDTLHDLLAARGGSVCLEGPDLCVSIHLHPGELELSDILVAPVLETCAQLIDALLISWRALPERMLEIVEDRALSLDLRAHAAKLLFTRFANTSPARDAAHTGLHDPALCHVCLTWSADPMVFTRFIVDGGSLDTWRTRRLKAIQRAEFPGDTLALGIALLEAFSPELILDTCDERTRSRLIAALLHARRAPWVAWLATALRRGLVLGHSLLAATDIAHTPVPSALVCLLLSTHCVQDRPRVLALVHDHYDEHVEQALLGAIDPTWTPGALETTATVLSRRGTPRALEPLRALHSALSWAHPISRLKLRSAISIIHRRALRQHHHAPGALSLSSEGDERGRLSLAASLHGALETPRDITS